MEDDYINISTLNDFIFCPYSIYLHNVYMDADEDIYHATPQIQGRISHASVDNKQTGGGGNVISSLPVYSEKYRLTGKIDVYKKDRCQLIERKQQLKQIFRGQIYQLWAQMYCLTEMGYEVNELSFYEISTNRMIPVKLPTTEDEEEFSIFLQRFRAYNPEQDVTKANSNKCSHCIYNNLCYKTDVENVYS